MPSRSIQAGPYSGQLYEAWPSDPAFLDALGKAISAMEASSRGAWTARNRMDRVTLAVAGQDRCFSVKSFSRESRWRDLHFARVGSKARRSFDVAAHLADRGVGTPKPLACLERWDGSRLAASHYLCEFQDDITSFRDELNRLYREDPLCRRIMDLMQAVAYAIADMHDAGVFHRDLGNQNILLRRKGEGAWGDVQFIDLNRARILPRLDEAERARDISRIDLPSDFLRVFKCMYHRDQHPSDAFNRHEERYRRRFALHTASRAWRHPIREYRIRRTALPDGTPRGQDLWVWDDRSVQAVSTLISRDRHEHYPAINHFFILKGTLKSLHPVHRLYRAFRAESFTREVAMAGRIGMAVGTEPGGEARERPFVSALGPLPVLVRLYRHADEATNDAALAEARRLKAQGHPVMAALVQDRAGVRDLSRWRDFCRRYVPALAGVADWLEVGHAVNRVKWGLWDVRDYRRLLEEVVAANDGAIRISGPAVIDFEYHYLAALLDLLRDGPALDALSLHLYVDRRGAPENRQGSFSAVEKFALARAYAAWSPAVKQDRIIVSEVNWPLLDTGAYSPVCSPYVIPNSHTNDPSVNEEAYADYLVRYYLLALCSGHVDAVYWWRLVARGFGLIDDSVEPWRPRPAYRAMEALMRMLGSATFAGRLNTPEGVYALRFRTVAHGDVVLAWAHPGDVVFAPPFRFDAMRSRDGGEAGPPGASIRLGGSPVYFLGVR